MNKTNNFIFKSGRSLLALTTLALGIQGHALADDAAVSLQRASLIAEGDYAGYYAIANAGNLLWFADTVNNGAGQSLKAVLTADIVLNENVLAEDGSLNGTPALVWTPIGTSNKNFYGTFDGAGHTVSGLYFQNTSSGSYPSGGDYVGLIGYANNATIRNVGVIDSYLHGRYDVGGICGYTKGTTTVSGCANTSTIKASSMNSGGICGRADYCVISNCYNSGMVGLTGINCAGGITAYGDGLTVTSCFNVGAVVGSSNVGSIIGEHSSSETVSYCVYLSTQAADSKSVAKDAAAFASGEVTYVLNGNSSEGAWGQALGTDAFPVLGSTAKVYPVGTLKCNGMDVSEALFSNTPGEFVVEPVVYNANGISEECGYYQPATLITEGDYAGYYAIANAGNLLWFADTVNNGNSQSLKAVLTADIVLNEDVLNADGSLNGTPAIAWTPIGTSNKNFSGTFDGAGHTVSGLYFQNTSSSSYPNGGYYVGLIGCAYEATIRNVGVVGSYIHGYGYVGSICGYLYRGSVSRCWNASTVRASDDIGGIVGRIYSSGSVSGCYSLGSVSGSSIVGTDAGQGVVSNCVYLSTQAADSRAVAKDAEAFASGEVAYVLNGYSSEGAWGQALGTDAFPVLGSSAKVYLVGTLKCNGMDVSEALFSNTPGELVVEPVVYDENGISEECGFYQPATLITEGDYAGYYAIANAGNLLWFADTVNNGSGSSNYIKAVLTADIVLNENVLAEDGSLNGTPALVWTPIGTSNKNFYGTFDGAGHTVSGLYFQNTSSNSYPSGGNNVGLIGCAYGATIRNVGVVDSYIHGCGYVGSICGYLNRGSVSRCWNASTVRASGDIGGIVGRIYSSGSVSDCYSLGSVSGSSIVGTDAGQGVVSNCVYLSTQTADSRAVAKDAAAFASGEVAYLLNGYSSEGAWGQALGTDAFPVLGSSAKVYPVGTLKCKGMDVSEALFSNTPGELVVVPVVYNENGISEECGFYQPATLITEGDYAGYYAISNTGNLLWLADTVGSSDVIDMKVLLTTNAIMEEYDSAPFFLTPKQGTLEVVLSEDVSAVKLYDNGGKTDKYPNSCRGYVKLTSAEGTIMTLSGSSKTENTWDKLSVYDGLSTSDSKLVDAKSGTLTLEGVTSSGNDMMIYFYSDGSSVYDGYELEVAIKYSVAVDASVVNGVLEVDATSAFKGETVHVVTATPEEGFELEAIYVNGEPLEPGEMEFVMPARHVVVSASFVKSVVTGVDEVAAQTTEDDDTIFDLAGRQVGRETTGLKPGLYVRGGKLIQVK